MNERHLARAALRAAAQPRAPDRRRSVGAGRCRAVPVRPPSRPHHGSFRSADYTTDIWTREVLLGDLWCARSDLADKGFSFHVDYPGGAVDRGRVDATRPRSTAGSVDYLANLDLDRMGLIPAVSAHAAPSRATQFGQRRSECGFTGELRRAGCRSHERSRGHPITITSVNYTQFLSPHFGVLAGKIDTADGDLNEFSSGRGTSQFMNSNFIANGVFAVGLPYSTLGVGAVWIPTPKIDVGVTLANATDASRTSGFGDIGDGWLVAFEAHFHSGCESARRHHRGRRPSTSKTRVRQDQVAAEVRASARPASRDGRQHGMSVRHVWQYLYVKDANEAPIDSLEGSPIARDRTLWARGHFR